MVVDTIVLCPGLAGPTSYDRHDLRRELSGRPGAVPGPAVAIVDVPAGAPGEDERTARAHWVAHVAVQLSAEATRGPVLLVLDGRTGPLAPSLGLSQRAARRQVAGYVLVDADPPVAGQQGDDWPDAPVAYLASPSADPVILAHARLRGWRLLPLPDLGAVPLATAVLTLVNPGG